jgi:hypothetical protein
LPLAEFSPRKPQEYAQNISSSAFRESLLDHKTACESYWLGGFRQDRIALWQSQT